MALYEAKAGNRIVMIELYVILLLALQCEFHNTVQKQCGSIDLNWARGVSP